MSQDSDCIPFGAPLMLRDFTCEEKKPVKEFNSTKVCIIFILLSTYLMLFLSSDVILIKLQLLHELKLSSHDEFLDFCILCGCDYLATMEGNPSNSIISIILLILYNSISLTIHKQHVV